MPAPSKSNPNGIGVDNRYAGFKAPSRPDASTVGPGGNKVDRKSINPTRDSVNPTPERVFPGGRPAGY